MRLEYLAWEAAIVLSIMESTFEAIFCLFSGALLFELLSLSTMVASRIDSTVAETSVLVVVESSLPWSRLMLSRVAVVEYALDMVD